MAHLIPFIARHKYQTLPRSEGEGGRRYVTPDGKKLPSVTTILGLTKDQTGLNEWKARVGEQEAERIKNEAATVGTFMHLSIEQFLRQRPLQPPKTVEACTGYGMGYRIINELLLSHLSEVWGNEIPLYYPSLYAGTADLIGVYKGKSSVVDFKQANKPKRREWIEDYFMQLAAYALAHDMVHKTHIEGGAILVCVRNTGELQEFTTTGDEFENYKAKWLARVDKYYKLTGVENTVEEATNTGEGGQNSNGNPDEFESALANLNRVT